MKREFMNVKPDPPTREGVDWESIYYAGFYGAYVLSFSVFFAWVISLFLR